LSREVGQCLRMLFIWPYNAHPVLVNNSATSHPQGPNADYSDMGLIRADALRRWGWLD